MLETVIKRNKIPRFFDVVQIGESGATCKILYQGLTFEAASSIIEDMQDFSETH